MAFCFLSFYPYIYLQERIGQRMKLSNYFNCEWALTVMSVAFFLYDGNRCLSLSQHVTKTLKNIRKTWVSGRPLNPTKLLPILFYRRLN